MLIVARMDNIKIYLHNIDDLPIVAYLVNVAAHQNYVDWLAIQSKTERSEVLRSMVDEAGIEPATLRM